VKEVKQFTLQNIENEIMSSTASMQLQINSNKMEIITQKSLSGRVIGYIYVDPYTESLRSTLESLRKKLTKVLTANTPPPWPQRDHTNTVTFDFDKAKKSWDEGPGS